ncbi:MAG: hypothetical protein ACJ77K_06465 [Bacteroidia bacterium]
MEFWKKVAAGTLTGGILIGGVLFIPKLLRLKAAAPQLDVIPSAKIHKLDFTGVTIRIDVKLKNPTSAAFKMKYPYIRLTYKDYVIGTSQSVDQDIEMPPFGEANIDAIMFNIPILSVIGMAGALLKAVQNNLAVEVDIATITEIDPYWRFDDDAKTWKRMINLGTKSMIHFENKITVSLRRQQ